MKCLICFRNYRNKTNPFSVCKDCYEDYYINNEMVIPPIFLSHMNPAKMIFHRESYERKKNLYCGVELEIQGNKTSEFVIHNALNDFVWFKHDGSLDYYRGVEIVSHPATLKYHLHHWNNIFNRFASYEMNDLVGCGLHFHFNRDYFTDFNISNIDYFINENPHFIESLGGRKFNDYCQCIKKPLGRYGYFYHQDRYSALNLENKNTIELRFFRATNCYERFIKFIITAYAIVIFCSKNNLFENSDVKNREDFVKFFENYYKDTYKLCER